MLSKYGCHSDNVGTRPRGRTTTSWAQDGWRVIQLPIAGLVTREPVMARVTTEWLPMKCGHIRQSGKGKDQLCAGCVNEKEQ